MSGLVIRSFGDAEERVTFDHGYLDLVKASSLALGREVLEPGWRWSVHVKPIVGGNAPASRRALRRAGLAATVKDGAFTAPYSAPSAGPPPWNLYALTPKTAFGVAGAESCGATRWRFQPWTDARAALGQ